MVTESSKSPSESLNKSYLSRVLKAAIHSRLVLLILTILWRMILTPYDTSATLNPTCLHDPSPSTSPLFPSFGSAIGNSVVWDSVYFVRIAECGYEYEQFYAFLPLLPACIFALSRTVFAPLVPLIGYRAVLALSGYVICNVAFIFAAIYFYSYYFEGPECSIAGFHFVLLQSCIHILLINVMISFISYVDFQIVKVIVDSLFFPFFGCFFCDCRYTESLYALFSVGGCYYLMSRANNITVLWLALSGFARSNGVLNAGYFVFQTMHQAYEAMFLKKRSFLALWILISGALRCICIFVPFIAFQAYGYYNICLGRSSDEMQPWCKARIPLLYNYIQSHYWGVGFLRYFELKQLPNFLLASPILSLAVSSIIYYVKSRPEIVLSLGFRASVEEKSSMAVIFSFQKSHRSNNTQFSEKYSSKIQENHNLKLRKNMNQGGYPAESKTVHGSLGYTSASILPFILHLGFMVATAFFVMYVQVATRFLSANPSLYWFASLIMTSPRMSKIWGYMIWTYCCAYILLGSLLFPNFYPFT